MVQKLYVGNLSYDTTVDELTELFGQYGEVHSVNLITDRDTGRPRGFGFVEMDNASEAMTSLNGHELGGRALAINEARERTSGGGGGGRGGGRGHRNSSDRRSNW